MLEKLPGNRAYDWDKDNILNHAPDFLKKKRVATHQIIARMLFEIGDPPTPYIDKQKFKKYICVEKKEITELQNKIQVILPILNKSSEEFKSFSKIAKMAQESCDRLNLVEKTIDDLKKTIFSMIANYTASAVLLRWTWVMCRTPFLEIHIQLSEEKIVPIGQTASNLAFKGLLGATILLAHDILNRKRLNNCKQQLIRLGQEIEKQLREKDIEQPACSSV